MSNLYNSSMMSRLRLALLVLFGLFSVHLSFGQADIWYVGNNIKMDFSGGGNPTVSKGLPSGNDLTENSTAISDQNGDLLFAVVGDDVYDGGGNAVFNLPSNTWNVAQGSIVFPVPGVDNEYYLSIMRFGPTAATKPAASYYKVTVNGSGAGNISVGSANNLAANLTEAQAGVPKVNPDFSVSDEYWLVTHEKCNNNFKVYSVTSSGISLSTTQAEGPSLVCTSSWPETIDDIGIMKFNNCYTQMVYAIGGKVQLYNFNAQSGQLTFVNSIDNIVQPYGVEFSSDGKYVYVLRGQDNNNPGEIYSIPVTGSGLGALTSLGTTGGMRGGHLQMAPDGNIYYAIPEAYANAGKGKIGRITNVDGGGTLDNNFYTATTADQQWVNMDMPTFLKSLVSSIATLKVNGKDLANSTVCQGETVTFSIEIEGSETPGVVWTATGANTDSDANKSSFTVDMTNAGTTSIQVDVVDDCSRSRTLKFNVEVLPEQYASATVSSTCPRIATGTGSSSGEYLWYDKDPASGGVIVGAGSTFDASAFVGGSIWVHPAGSLTSTSVQDNFNKWDNFNLPNDFELTVSNPAVSASINSFELNLHHGWASAAIVGDVVITLENSSGTVIGTPITVPINIASGTSGTAWTETLTPSDWNVGAGDYKVSFQAPTGINIARSVQNDFTDGPISFKTYNIVKTSITYSEEDSPAGCSYGAAVTIPACCTQEAPEASVKTGTATICQGETLVLTADPNPNSDPLVVGPFTYQWYNDDGAISGATSQDYTVPTTSAAAAKDYWVTVTNSGSCTGESPESNKISVTVNATPGAPSVTSPVEYCVGDAASDLSPTGTGLTWYTVATGGSGSPSVTPATTAAGTISYYVSKTENGCESSRSKLDVTVYAVPSAPTVTSPVEYCEKETASDLSPTGTGLTWYTVATGGTGAPSVTPATTTAGTTSYYVSKTENGCESSRAKVDVTVYAIPSAPTVNTPVEYCVGDAASSLSANASTGATLTWYDSPSGGAVIPSAPTPSTTAAGTTSYYVSQSVNGCESPRAEIKVVVNAVVTGTPTITGDLTVCEDATNKAYEVTGVSNAESYTWTVDGTASAETSSKLTIPAFTGLGGSTFAVEVEVGNSKCPATLTTSANLTVRKKTAAVGAISGSTTVCQGQTETYSISAVDGSNVTYTWTIPSGATLVSGGGSTDLFAEVTFNTGAGEIKVVAAGDCGTEETSVTVNYTAKVIPAVAISDPGTVCEDAALTLTLSKSENGGTSPDFVWTLDGVAQSSVKDDFLDLTAAEVKSLSGKKIGVQMTSDLSCADPKDSNVDEITLSVDAVPSDAVIQSPTGGTNICTTGLTLTADAITVGTGAWSVDDATKGSISSTGALTINNEGESVTVTYTVTSPNGVCTAQTDDITITRVGSITPPDAGSATTICEGTSHQLGANASLKATETGTWSFVSNSNGDAGTSVSFSDLNAHDATVSNLPFGDNVLQWEVADASSPCAPQAATVTISVDEAPETAALADPIMTTVPTCADPTNLDAEAASLASGGTTATGAWTLISGPGNIVSGQENNPAAQVENLVNGSQSVFRWTVSNGTCVDHSSVDVTLNKLSDITVAEITYGTDILVQDEEVDVCLDDGTINFNGSSAASGEQGTWTVVSGTSVALVNGSNTASQSGVTLTGIGKTEVTWSIAKTAASGCPASERTVVFNVTDVPEDPTAIIAAGGVTDVCVGETVNLSVATPFPARVVDYVWSSGIAGNSDSESHTFTSDPTETITVHARNACGLSKNSAPYTMNVVPAPSVDFSLPAGCKDEEVTFTANANASVFKLEWFVDGLSASTSNPFLYTFMDGALHKVKVVGELASDVQCTAGTFDEFELDFTAKAPTILVSSSDMGMDRFEELSSTPLIYVQRICGDETVVLTEEGDVVGVNTWTWEPSGTVTNGTVSGADFTSSSETMLKLSKDAGCANPLEARVLVEHIMLPSTVIEFESDSMLCSNDEQTVTLLGGEIDPDYAYQWSYRPLNGSWSPYSTEAGYITVSQPGEYKVFIEKDYGCGIEGMAFTVKELDVQVSLPSLVELDLREEDAPGAVEVVAEEIGQNKNYSYSWSSVSGAVNFSPADQQVVMAAAENQDVIIVTAELGRCSDSASTSLNVYQPVQIPAAFTPNGDGYNDNWMIGGLDSYPAASVKIYNRWGNEVYRKFEGYNGDWYGTRDGKELPDGVYFYVIELGTGDKSYRGSVTIAR